MASPTLAPRPASSTPPPRPGPDLGLYVFVALVILGMIAVGIAFSRL